MTMDGMTEEQTRDAAEESKIRSFRGHATRIQGMLMIAFSDIFVSTGHDLYYHISP